MKNATITPYNRPRRGIPLYIIDRCFFAAIVLVAIALIGGITTIAVIAEKTTHNAPEVQRVETVVKTPKTSREAKNGTADTTKKASASFALTEEQRTLIEQVVSAESRGEPYDGQVAVAQCILNACLKDGITPEQAIKKYKYTGARVEPTDSVKKAVAAVFDRGEGVTEEPIMYFYAPALVESKWHESQDFVVEIQNHRFFKEAK